MPKVTVRYTSDRAYLVSTSPRIIARYELLKSKPQARLKAMYFGFYRVEQANQFIAEFRLAIAGVRVELRRATRTAAEFEVVIRSPKVADMAIVERFCKTLLTAAAAAPKAQTKATVIQFPAPVPMPIAVGQVKPAGRIRPKLEKDHLGRTTIAGIHID
ncbi:MAG TPA: hypothetical protein V6D10_01405 [Trichocoleus sp.]|jgi:hypothetical protein